MFGVTWAASSWYPTARPLELFLTEPRSFLIRIPCSKKRALVAAGFWSQDQIMSALERWSLICKVSAALITDIQPPPARGLNYDALNQTWRLLQLEPFHTIWDTTSPLQSPPFSLCAKYLYLKPVRKLLPRSPSHPLTPFSSHLNMLLSEICRVVWDKNVNTSLCCWKWIGIDHSKMATLVIF